MQLVGENGGVPCETDWPVTPSSPCIQLACQLGNKCDRSQCFQTEKDTSLLHVVFFTSDRDSKRSLRLLTQSIGCMV